MHDVSTKADSAESFKDWITYPISWWALLFVLPVLRLFVGPLKRRPWIRPNHVTILSFLLGVIGAALVLVDGSWAFFSCGVLVFIAYFLDCMDGMIARMHRQSSAIGAFIDNTLDRWKTVLLTWSLLWVAIAGHSDIITALLLVINFGLYFVTITTDYEVKDVLRNDPSRDTAMPVPIGKEGVAGKWMVRQTGLAGRWMGLCYRLGLKPTVGEVEADMIVFCVGMILVGLYGWEMLRSCLLVSIVIYAIPVQGGYAYFFYRFFTSLPADTNAKGSASAGQEERTDR